MAEVDFIFLKNNKRIPVEVNAEENIKAGSLKFFSETFDITPSFVA